MTFARSNLKSFRVYGDRNEATSKRMTAGKKSLVLNKLCELSCSNCCLRDYCLELWSLELSRICEDIAHRFQRGFVKQTRTKNRKLVGYSIFNIDDQYSTKRSTNVICLPIITSSIFQPARVAIVGNIRDSAIEIQSPLTHWEKSNSIARSNCVFCSSFRTKPSLVLRDCTRLFSMSRKRAPDHIHRIRNCSPSADEFSPNRE